MAITDSFPAHHLDPREPDPQSVANVANQESVFDRTRRAASEAIATLRQIAWSEQTTHKLARITRRWNERRPTLPRPAGMAPAHMEHMTGGGLGEGFGRPAPSTVPQNRPRTTLGPALSPITCRLENIEAVVMCRDQAQLLWTLALQTRDAAGAQALFYQSEAFARAAAALEMLDTIGAQDEREEARRLRAWRGEARQ